MEGRGVIEREGEWEGDKGRDEKKGREMWRRRDVEKGREGEKGREMWRRRDVEKGRGGRDEGKEGG